MVSATPAGCILMSTGTVWPTWTRILATGLAGKPLSVARHLVDAGLQGRSAIAARVVGRRLTDYVGVLVADDHRYAGEDASRGIGDDPLDVSGSGGLRERCRAEEAQQR